MHSCISRCVPRSVTASFAASQMRGLSSSCRAPRAASDRSRYRRFRLFPTRLAPDWTRCRIRDHRKPGEWPAAGARPERAGIRERKFCRAPRRQCSRSTSSSPAAPLGAPVWHTFSAAPGSSSSTTGSFDQGMLRAPPSAPASLFCGSISPPSSTCAPPPAIAPNPLKSRKVNVPFDARRIRKVPPQIQRLGQIQRLPALDGAVTGRRLLLGQIPLRQRQALKRLQLVFPFAVLKWGRTPPGHGRTETLVPEPVRAAKSGLVGWAFQLCSWHRQSHRSMGLQPRKNGTSTK